MRLERRVDDAPVDRVTHSVVKTLGIGPRASIDGGELPAHRAAVVVSNRRRLIDRHRDYEDAIVGNRSRRVDDEGTDELRIEARSQQSMAVQLRRKWYVALPFGERCPVLIGPGLSSRKRYLAGFPRRKDQGIGRRPALTEAADDERIIERVADDDANRRSAAHAQQWTWYRWCLPLFGEGRDRERRVTVTNEVPGDRRRGEPQDERIAGVPSSRRTIVVRRGLVDRRRNSRDAKGGILPA